MTRTFSSSQLDANKGDTKDKSFAFLLAPTLNKDLDISIFEEELCHANVAESSREAFILDEMERSHIPCSLLRTSRENSCAILQFELPCIVQEGLNHVEEPWVTAQKGRQGSVLAAELKYFAQESRESSFLYMSLPGISPFTT